MDPTYNEDRTFFISRATKKLEDGLFDEASAMADERLSRYPGDVDAQIIAATALIRRGRLAEACDILERLDDMVQVWSQIYELLGFVYRKQEAPEEAIRAYKKFLTLNPASPMKGHISNKIDYLMDEVKEKHRAKGNPGGSDSRGAASPGDDTTATVTERETIPGEAGNTAEDEFPLTLEMATETDATETVTETEQFAHGEAQPAGDEIPFTLEMATETDATETVTETEQFAHGEAQPAEDEFPLTLEMEGETDAAETIPDDADDAPRDSEPAVEPDSGTEAAPEDSDAETMEGATEGDSESEERHDAPPPDFDTVTLADLYLQQGHRDMAQDVLNRILANDPEHEEARERLRQMTATAEASLSPVITELNTWLKNLQR